MRDKENARRVHTVLLPYTIYTCASLTSVTGPPNVILPASLHPARLWSNSPKAPQLVPLAAYAPQTVLPQTVHLWKAPIRSRGPNLASQTIPWDVEELPPKEFRAPVFSWSESGRTELLDSRMGSTTKPDRAHFSLGYMVHANCDPIYNSRSNYSSPMDGLNQWGGGEVRSMSRARTQSGPQTDPLYTKLRLLRFRELGIQGSGAGRRQQLRN